MQQRFDCCHMNVPRPVHHALLVSCWTVLNTLQNHQGISTAELRCDWEPKMDSSCLKTLRVAAHLDTTQKRRKVGVHANYTLQMLLRKTALVLLPLAGWVC